jgi:ABC-type transport system substrate-binding protein
MKLRLCLSLAAISIALAALPLETARRPRYGGTLRVEIGVAVNSLDPPAATASAAEAAAKEQIDELVYPGRNSDGSFFGAAGDGPFRIAAWEPGKRVALTANDNFRDGRPFVDSVEIQMGRAAHDRLVDLELGKADFAEIPPDQARAARDQGVRISPSLPDELLALVFAASETAQSAEASASTRAKRSPAEDPRVREAIARSLDRAAIVNFILQKEGEPAGGLLPQWSSGTAFLFSPARDSSHAKELWAQLAPVPRVVLGYDSEDSLEKAVAERIAVNARESGIALTLKAIPASAATTSATAAADARLVRLRMASSAPRAALSGFLQVLSPLTGIDPAPLPDPASPEEIYNRERAVVSSYRVVPLVWLPQVYGLSARVRDWRAPAPGEAWPLADVWLEEEQK